MKKWAWVAVLVCVLTTTGVSVGVAGNFYNCAVLKLGVAFGTYYILLDDQASPKAFQTWFLLDPQHQKDDLAIALTAMANNKLLNVYVEPVIYSPIQAMYMLP